MTRSINSVCPWSGNPVASDAETVYRGRIVAFCSRAHRDKFETALNFFLTRSSSESGEDARKIYVSKSPLDTSGAALATGLPINAICPMKSKPVDENQSIMFAGFSVGFCCSECKREFKSALESFDQAILADSSIEAPTNPVETS